MTDYRTEFPDFPPETMPAIPEGWTDQSWHNDSCPSFDTGKGVSVFIDFAEVQKREHELDGPRFSVMSDPNKDGIPVEELSTDDWAEVLAFVGKLNDAS